MKTAEVLRYMAWERAKGELRSMLDTYEGSEGKKYAIMRDVINDFIEDIEDYGKHE